MIQELELIELKPKKKLGNKQVKFFNYKNDSPIDLSRYQIYSESQLYYLLKQQNQNKGLSSKMKLLWELTMTEEEKKPYIDLEHSDIKNRKAYYFFFKAT